MTNKIFSVIMWYADETPQGQYRVLSLFSERERARAFCKEYAESKKQCIKPLRALYIVEQKLNNEFIEPDADDCVWSNY